MLGGLLYAAYRWFSFSPLLCGLVLVGWFVKDVLFYPMLRPHYHFAEKDAHERYLGNEAVAQEALSPRGYVKLGGELWLAEVGPDDPPVSAGETVVVESVDGLTLKVKR